MYHLRLAHIGLIVCVAFCCTVQVSAADGKLPEATRESAPASDAHIVTIEFPGGPLSKLVSSFSAKGIKCSIIQSASLDPIIPSFEVRGEPLDAVIRALGRILEPQGFELTPVSPSLAVLQPAHADKPAAFATFSLERKLGAHSIEEFTAAVQAACEFAYPDQKRSTLRFKYHPATKLLFVAGSNAEVDVVHRVFGNLPDIPLQTAPRSSENK